MTDGRLTHIRKKKRHFSVVNETFSPISSSPGLDPAPAMDFSSLVLSSRLQSEEDLLLDRQRIQEKSW